MGKRKSVWEGKMPPGKRKFGKKQFRIWCGVTTKQVAEKKAKVARKEGDKVRIVKRKDHRGKSVYWLYYRSAEGSR